MTKKLALLFILITGLLIAGTDTFQKEVDARTLNTVKIENVNGDIQVIAWERELVQVNATIKGTASELKEIEIKVEPRGDTLLVTTELGKRFLWGFIPFKRGGRVDYAVQVPDRMSVVLESVNGSLSVEGVAGTVEAETVNGSFAGRQLGGRVQIESVNGGAEAQMISMNPEFEAETINGSITLTIPEAAGCRYRFETVNGRINFIPEKIEVHGVGPKDVKGTLGNGLGFIHVEVINGSISVNFDE